MKKVKLYKNHVIHETVCSTGEKEYDVYTSKEWKYPGYRKPEYEGIQTIEQAKELIDGLIKNK